MKNSVLIVDDEETDRYLLSRQLKRTRLVNEIFEARDGEEAISFFEDHEKNVQEHPDSYPPQIVFLDINMPRVNGYEFLSAFTEIRKAHDLASTVVMMFSSSDHREDKERAFGHEFVKEYLVKGSFTTDQLRSYIEPFL